MFPLALTFQLLRNQKRCHGSRLSYRRHEVIQMEDIPQDVGGYPCAKSDSSSATPVSLRPHRG